MFGVGFIPACQQRPDIRKPFEPDPAMTGTMQAEIYTMAGKSMWSGTITDILTLNVTELPRGLYFIRMKGDSGELVRKFQVE